MSLERPSRFWEELAHEQRQDLAVHGFENCKRHQALRYFSWRWSWSAMRESVQMRFLLRESSIAAIARTAVTPVGLSDAAWEGISWPKRERWLNAFATRLLWQYAVAHDSSSVTGLPEPLNGNPLPISWRGRLVSQDLANTAIEVSAILRALDGRVPRSILEVGAGYGRTAYALLSIFPEASYTIVDIKPAIEISSWYLHELFPAERLRFVSPDEVDEIATGSVDLALSISSLQEMTAEQVEGYLETFDRVAERGLVFLKQWISWRNPVDNIQLRFDEYPIPARWRMLFKERAPVQTNFAQAAWVVDPTTHAPD
jgi:putative sugar O-methyltransferase